MEIFYTTYSAEELVEGFCIFSSVVWINPISGWTSEKQVE